jgi:hypothetical protein
MTEQMQQDVFDFECETWLPNPGAAALDQNAKQNNENYGGDNADNHYTGHITLLSLSGRDVYQMIAI